MPRLLLLTTATAALLLSGGFLAATAEAWSHQNKTLAKSLPSAPAPKYPGKRMDVSQLVCKWIGWD